MLLGPCDLDNDDGVMLSSNRRKGLGMSTTDNKTHIYEADFAENGTSASLVFHNHVNDAIAEAKEAWLKDHDKTEAEQLNIALVRDSSLSPKDGSGWFFAEFSREGSEVYGKPFATVDDMDGLEFDDADVVADFIANKYFWGSMRGELTLIDIPF